MEENKTAALEKENEELKKLLEYYYGAEQLLEKANMILESALDSEKELSDAATKIDDIAFDNDHELQRREMAVEEREKEAKKLLASAQKKEKDALKYIEAKAQKRIAEYKSYGIRIIAGITIVYTIVAFMIYLAA